jgi:hypothetical protein
MGVTGITAAGASSTSGIKTLRKLLASPSVKHRDLLRRHAAIVRVLALCTRGNFPRAEAQVQKEVPWPHILQVLSEPTLTPELRDSYLLVLDELYILTELRTGVGSSHQFLELLSTIALLLLRTFHHGDSEYLTKSHSERYTERLPPIRLRHMSGSKSCKSSDDDGEGLIDLLSVIRTDVASNLEDLFGERADAAVRSMQKLAKSKERAKILIVGELECKFKDSTELEDVDKITSSLLRMHLLGPCLRLVVSFYTNCVANEGQRWISTSMAYRATRALHEVLETIGSSRSLKEDYKKVIKYAKNIVNEVYDIVDLGESSKSHDFDVWDSETFEAVMTQCRFSIMEEDVPQVKPDPTDEQTALVLTAFCKALGSNKDLAVAEQREFDSMVQCLIDAEKRTSPTDSKYRKLGKKGKACDPRRDTVTFEDICGRLLTHAVHASTSDVPCAIRIMSIIKRIVDLETASRLQVPVPAGELERAYLGVELASIDEEDEYGTKTKKFY